MASARESLEHILHVLSGVDRPGDYYAAGTVESPAPHLGVDGVGGLSFPVPVALARELVGVADQAPYGRGGQTLVDPAVRRVWQIGAERIEVGPRWAKTVDAIALAAASGLGVQGKVEAELYKLLVYDEGGFFVEHRDTEKVDGMFATLVVVLPSAHEGGELVVRHADRTVTLAVGGSDPAEIPWAAFFADCAHEVRPVVAGYRVCLVYNLVRRKGAPLRAPDHEGAVTAIAAALREWGRAGEPWPPKVALALAHHYTPAGLSFAGLKNADRGVAAVVVEAARRASCAVHLAMVAITESGTAEENHGGGRWRRRYDDEEFEVIEVLHREVAVHGWIAADDRPVALGPILVEPGEVWPPDAISEEKPDEQEYHEATGNEGAEFERTYRRAALILWPADGLTAVLAQAPPRAAVPALEHLFGEDPSAAVELARGVVDRWEEHDNPSWRFGPSVDWPARRADLNDNPIRLGATEELRVFLEQVVVPAWSTDRRDKHDDLIAAALGRLEPNEAASVAAALFREAARCPDRCVGLLAQLLADGSTEVALAAVEDLVESLPGDPARARAQGPWRSPPVTPDLVISLFRSLWRLPVPALAERAARRAATWYGIDKVVLPAALSLAPDATDRPGWAELRGACLAVLTPRLGQELEAPADLARSAQWPCPCADCASLRAFLASPNERSWLFKAAERRRQHIQGVVGAHQLDVDCVTRRGTSPLTLVCTKNRNTYERRVAQRAADLAAVEKLGVRPTGKNDHLA